MFTKLFRTKSFFIALILTIFFSSKVQAFTLNRSYGNDRYQTAVAISKEGWTTSDYVIIANGENFPDALSATPLAAYYNAPILLTSRASITLNTLDELKRLKVKNVIIIGGPGVVSDAIISSITTLSYEGQTSQINFERVYGQDRFQTSVEIAKRLPKSSKIAVLSGENFPDALSMAPFAAKNKMPILLVSKTKVSSAAMNFLANNSISKTYIIGGSGVISDTVSRIFNSPERIWGANRYETNIKILQHFQNDIDISKMFVASGENFPDGLAGSALVPKLSAGIVLTSKTPSSITRDFVNTNFTKISTLNILGGTGVLPLGTIQNLLVDRQLGATAGNSNNESFINYSNGWLYNRNNGEFFIQKLNVDTYKRTAHLTSQKSQVINITDKYIFYINLDDNCKLYRMNLDGSNKKRITSQDSTLYFVVYDNYIYYTNSNDSDKIYRIDINGSGRKKITDDGYCQSINVTKDYIYYTSRKADGTSSVLYRANRDGSSKTLLRSGYITFAVVWGDAIYFLDGYNDHNPSKINLNGTSYQKLSDDQAYNMNIIGDTIYYSNLHDKFKVYKIRTDGTSRECVDYTNPGNNINILGDYLYYSSDPNNTHIKRLKAEEFPKKTSSAPKNFIGNSPSNIINDAYVAAEGNYIYETSSFNGTSYKYKLDGSEKVKLPYLTLGQMNIAGDWAYFTGGSSFGYYPDNKSIYKMKADGSGLTTLISYDNASYLTVSGDWIYYVSVPYSEHSGSIVRVKLDGTGKTYFPGDEAAYYLNVIGDWIYYIDENDNNNIYKVRIDGTQITKVYDKPVSFLLLTEDGNYAYFRIWGDKTLYRMSLKDGSVISMPLKEDTSYAAPDSLVINKDKVFYTRYDKIYSCNLDGTSEKFITNCSGFSKLNTAGDYLYFDSTEGNYHTKIKIR